MNQKTQKIFNYLGIFIFLAVIIFVFSVIQKSNNLSNVSSPSTYDFPLVEPSNVREATPSEIQEVLSLFENTGNVSENNFENIPSSLMPLPELSPEFNF